MSGSARQPALVLSPHAFNELSGRCVACPIKFLSRRIVAGQFSPLRLWRLPKADAWSATVLFDELDPRGVDRGYNFVGRLIPATKGPVRGL